MNEVFAHCIGDIRIEDNGYVAQHGTTMNDGSVRGNSEYKSGRHRLRFKIENYSTWVFIGILSKVTSLENTSYKSSTSYGWVSEDYYFISGQPHKTANIFSVYNNHENDIIELIIDVANQTLHYTNERINRLQTMTINTTKCPLPWQLIISLTDFNGRIRLLDYTDLK